MKLALFILLSISSSLAFAIGENQELNFDEPCSVSANGAYVVLAASHREMAKMMTYNASNPEVTNHVLGVVTASNDLAAAMETYCKKMNQLDATGQSAYHLRDGQCYSISGRPASPADCSAAR